MGDECKRLTTNNLALYGEICFGTLLSLELDKGEWLLSRPGHFNPTQELAVLFTFKAGYGPEIPLMRWRR